MFLFSHAECCATRYSRQRFYKKMKKSILKVTDDDIEIAE